MLKRLFWLFVGFILGVLAVTKSQAYVRVKTPKAASDFLLGPEQKNTAARTLGGLVAEYDNARRQREAELNETFANRNR